MLPVVAAVVTGISPAQNYSEPDEENPARVARVSYTEGSVKIRRDGEEEWEDVVRDLPVVEGDEITSGADGRFEIQFNTDTHVRVANDSKLKIESLSEEGIAVSLSSGILNLTARKFDPDKSFLEVDAPGTTVAVLRAGRYRVDAPADGAEVRVGISSGGEARVYSGNAGFTLNSGRSASLFINGANAGEWEMRDYAGVDDDFDKWTFDRDDEFAKRLAVANYGEYYDDSLYGAEDLNTYGSWVHNASYGYVWRPSVSSLSNYSNWSPYRYGNWRWIPSFGWTWVNDEPWGWTTYHNGRWFWNSGNWYWSPFGANRNTAYRWRPALVYITTISSNICWYPLPFNSPYYDYNARYLFDRRRNRTDGADAANTVPVQPAASTRIVRNRGSLGGRITPVGNIPASAVTAVSVEQFGRERRGIARASSRIAESALNAASADEGVPTLPLYRRTGGRIAAQTSLQPTPVQSETGTNIGAAPRSARRPLDSELRNTRFLNSRRPAGRNSGVPITPLPNTGVSTPAAPIERPKFIKETPPVVRPRGETPPVVRPRSETPTYVPRVRTPITRRENPDSTSSSPEPARPTANPRRETVRPVPERKEPTTPVNSPPVRRRSEPPQRSAPPQRTPVQNRQPSPPPSSSSNSSSGQTRSAPPARSSPVRPAPPSQRKTRPD